MVRQIGESDPAERPVTAWDVPRWLDLLAGWLWRLALVGLAVWAFLQVFGLFRLVTVPILFALILAALFWPLRTRLTRWGVPELLATWMIAVIALGSLGGIAWLAVVGIGEQLEDSEQWSETRAEIDTWLMEGPLGLTAAEIDEYEQRLENALVTGVSSIGPGGARIATELLASVLLTAVLVFFFIKDGPKLWAYVVEHIRPKRQDSVAEAGRSAFKALTGYARGVAITGVVDAVLIGAVLLLLGVPLAVPLALLTFFAAFIPIVGATIVGALSVVVALVSLGVREALIVGVATLVIQQVEGDVVMPLAMGTQVRLHPAVVLTVLAAGGALAGLIGALVAVPMTAMVVAALRGLNRAIPETAGPTIAGTSGVVETPPSRSPDVSS